MSNKPIGLFDSGIGGLTVAKTVKEVLPNEQLIYFGDTAHLPYGDKSEAAIQAYSVKIADILLKEGCKVILIACNSASSAAFDLLTEYTGTRAKVMNVIDPMVSYINDHYDSGTIGLIGTKRTVLSGVYQGKIDQLGKPITLKSLATPLLVPMIEEGFFNNKISEEIIEEYLHHSDLDDIQALILGCTHYPIIKKQIDHYYAGNKQVIDSAHVVADELKRYLIENKELSTSRLAEDVFMISDYTDSFASSADMFFQQKVSLKHYPLWE